MKVPFLDLKAQLPHIRAEVEERFGRIIDNTAFVCGREVGEFEETFSNNHQSEYCVGLSSGTDGNHMALMCSSIGIGDEVILPVNTFIATAEAISYTGAIPVFVDANPDTFNIDVDKIEELITPKTRAINAVHLYGQPADLDPIIEIAKRHNLLVIEDAAQAHLAEYKEQRVGGIGDMASWSFYPGKNLGAWGEAGALTTNNDEIHKKARILRDHGSGKKYYHDFIGFNYRMSEFQAAVLNVKMKYLDQWSEQRRVNAQKYDSYLAKIDQVKTPAVPDYVIPVYHLYVIRVPRRDELLDFLRENDIGAGMHYPIPLHLTKAYAHLGYQSGDFPVAEQLAGEILSLPMYPELAEDQIKFVCNKIKDFLQ